MMATKKALSAAEIKTFCLVSRGMHPEEVDSTPLEDLLADMTPDEIRLAKLNKEQIAQYVAGGAYAVENYPW
jgi:hypothetical protein